MFIHCISRPFLYGRPILFTCVQCIKIHHDCVICRVQSNGANQLKFATSVVAQMLCRGPSTLSHWMRAVQMSSPFKKSSHTRPLMVPGLDFSLARMSCLQMWREQEVRSDLYIYTMHCLGAYMLHWHGNICCVAWYFVPLTILFLYSCLLRPRKVQDVAATKPYNCILHSAEM